MILTIHGGHEKILAMLLDANVSLSCADFSPSDKIPLHQAIRCSNKTMTSILQDCGANVQTRDELSRTAPFETLDCDDDDGARFLLKHGIDISFCAFKHASLFVDRGIELNERNEEGLTPLYLAARHNHCTIVDYLLRKGADVNLIDRQIGRTPLMYTASNGSTQLCHTLLSRGANVAKVSTDNKTSLMIAANAGHHAVAELY